MLVASPRNQLNRHEEVARFWRPYRFLGGSQHRGQIPSQLDPELALLRSQDNRIDQSTEHLGGFQAGVLALEGSGELLDLRAIEVGHARVKEGRRFVRDLELSLEFLSAPGVRVQFVLTSLAGSWSSRTRSISFFRASIRASSRFAEVMPAPCSMRSRFISFANSRQNSSKKSLRINLS
jgi:hypothetical protein